jgi:hypothetical protein
MLTANADMMGNKVGAVELWKKREKSRHLERRGQKYLQ